MNRKAVWLTTTIIVVAILLFYVSPRLLMAKSIQSPAGAIVLLGGENGDRVFRAAELFHERLAPWIVVTGRGESRKCSSRLQLAQVPRQCIIEESEARSTAQNAEFVCRILRQNHVHKAIIVTTWWHTARALRCFRHYAPEIEFMTAYANEEERPRPGIDQFLLVMIEYIKTGWYAARYGIH